MHMVGTGKLCCIIYPFPKELMFAAGSIAQLLDTSVTLATWFGTGEHDIW